MSKPDCYSCRYRGGVPGDAHSCCRYPGNKTGMFEFFEEANVKNAEKLNIQAHRHGIVSGWFYWPVNFDPVWLLNCKGYEEKINSREGEK